MPTVTSEVQVVKEKPGVSAKTGKSYVAYSMLAGNEWYSCGFTKPSVAKGDTVEIDFVVGTYGKEMKAVTRKSTGAPSTKANASGGAKDTSMKPVLLNNSRSIVRQNALHRATELYIAANDKVTAKDKDVKAIIALAAQFEAYTTGDLDIAEVKAAEALAKKATLSDIPDDEL